MDASEPLTNNVVAEGISRGELAKLISDAVGWLEYDGEF